MTDRPRGDGPVDPEPGEGYDWLYATSSRGAGSSDASPGSSGSRSPAGSQAGARDPALDPTEVVAGGAAGSTPPGRTDGEPTRVLTSSAQRPPQGTGTPSAPSREAPPPRHVAPTPTQTSSPGGRGRRRFRLRWLWAVVALWAVFMVAVPLVAWSKVTKVDATPAGSRPADQPGTTYLLVGSDSRAGLTQRQRRQLGTGGAAGQRTDTIMLLHTGRGPNLLMSIPRDSLVPVPGHGTTKINAAYALGGAKLLVSTVEQNTGIRIDDYVEIGFGGFVDVVDAVGGIQICPTQNMTDPLANLHIKKGCQHADGGVALGYARSRHASQLGDIDRAAHQREVVSAVGSKALSAPTILNPVRYVRLSFAGARSVTVGDDVGPLDFTRFAFAMTRVDGQHGLTCGVPISDLTVHWDTQRADRLFKLIRQDRTSDVSRQLCEKSGLAR